MKFYFFGTLPATHAGEFKDHYADQNLKAARFSAAIIGFISVSILTLSLVFNFESNDPRNSFYLQNNTILIAACALTLAFSYFYRFDSFISRNPHSRQLISFLFCLSYAYCCLAVSFAPNENPRNASVMFLLGLTVVVVLWNFEYWQHLLFAIIIEATFVIGVSQLPLTLNEKLLNYALSVFLITFFFVAGRMFYSFRANQFMQLKEIEKKNSEIERMSQAKSDIMGVVAHDLLSPFASIESLINLIRKQNLTEEKQEQYFNLVLSQCRTSRNLIHDLLETARFESETHFLTEKTEINSFLEEICTKWQTQLKDEREISFNRSGSPLYANLNKERFSRVLDNLLANAVKFTFEHGQITINLTRKESELLLYISDDGIGIPQHLQPYLFERFSKARRKGLQGEDSTGLGLSITQQLVSQHGGSIKVESAENAGTTFSIVLPAAN